jgi:hypothetical protein
MRSAPLLPLSRIRPNLPWTSAAALAECTEILPTAKSSGPAPRVEVYVRNESHPARLLSPVTGGKRS